MREKLIRLQAKKSTGRRSASEPVTCRPVLLFCVLTILLTACQLRPSVTLALLGDINLGRGVRPSANSFGFVTPYLRTADLALANLESPLTTYPPEKLASDKYNLCTLSAPPQHLADWGLDLLSLANNHRFDCGESSPSGTALLLEQVGLTPLGLTSEPILRQINGLTLAFFAFDDVLAPLDIESAAEAIARARSGGTLVIVSIHWGMEYQVAPSERQGGG